MTPAQIADLEEAAARRAHHGNCHCPPCMTDFHEWLARRARTEPRALNPARFRSTPPQDRILSASTDDAAPTAWQALAAAIAKTREG